MNSLGPRAVEAKYLRRRKARRDVFEYLMGASFGGGGGGRSDGERNNSEVMQGGSESRAPVAWLHIELFNFAKDCVRL